MDRKTDFSIPAISFSSRNNSLEKIIKISADEYDIEGGSVLSQIKKLIPDIDSKNAPEYVLSSIAEVYNNHFDALTALAKVILTNICAKQAQKKLNWLREKQAPDERIKKTEMLAKEALERERKAAITCFLRPQKDFIDNYTGMPESEQIGDIELELDAQLKEIIKKKAIKRLAELTIESPKQNFINDLYDIYDRLQEQYWIKEDKAGCQKINAKKITLLLKHVQFPRNFKNYYYQYAKTVQRISECIDGTATKQRILEKCTGFLEKRFQVDRSFNQSAHLGLGDIYVSLAQFADKKKALEYLDKASKEYHTAVNGKEIKKANLAIVSSKLGNCHIGKLKLAKEKKISEKFLDYLQALKHLAEAHFVMSEMGAQAGLLEYKKKLGTTLFHLGKDLSRSDEQEFRKIADLLKYYDPISNEHYEKASDTVIRRVRSIMLPEKYAVDQKESLLMRIFTHAKSNLKESEAEASSIYDSLKVSEQIARCCLYIGSTYGGTRQLEEARTILEDMIAKAKKLREGDNNKFSRKLSKYYNFLGEAHNGLSQKGNVLERVKNKLKSIENYSQVSRDAPTSCYSNAATNYLGIAEIVLEERAFGELQNICKQLGIDQPEKTIIAGECYSRAIKLFHRARENGDKTAEGATKIGRCYYETAKLKVLELEELEKRLKRDLLVCMHLQSGVKENIQDSTTAALSEIFGGDKEHVTKSMEKYMQDYEEIDPDNVEEYNLIWQKFYGELKQHFAGSQGRIYKIEKEINELIERAITEFDDAIRKDIKLGNEKNPYLPPFWLKADLASYFHKQKNKIEIKHPATENPAEAWAEFFLKSSRDCLRGITNCNVWRAKGRGAEEVTAIFKSPKDEAQTLKLEKIIIEGKEELNNKIKTQTGRDLIQTYEVKWLLLKKDLEAHPELKDREILILQSKGTKTLNERISENTKRIRIAQKHKIEEIADKYKCFHDETLKLYTDAVTEMVRNKYAIKEIHAHGLLHKKAEQEGFNLDEYVVKFALEDYYNFSNNAIKDLNLEFGRSTLPQNTYVGQDDDGKDLFASLGDQYTKAHLKAIMREIIKNCIWPMQDGFDFDPNGDNVMVYDDEEITRVACGIDFEKLKIRKYIAGLCMLLFYDNPKIPKESGAEDSNFLTPSHKKEIIDHFIVEEARVENDDPSITIDRLTYKERFQVHRDVTVYMPLRRIGLAANEKRKLNTEKEIKLTKEETELLKRRQLEDIDWLKADVAHAIKSADPNLPMKELGKLYSQDRSYFTILNDILESMKIIP